MQYIMFSLEHRTIHSLVTKSHCSPTCNICYLYQLGSDCPLVYGYGNVPSTRTWLFPDIACVEHHTDISQTVLFMSFFISKRSTMHNSVYLYWPTSHPLIHPVFNFCEGVSDCHYTVNSCEMALATSVELPMKRKLMSEIGELSRSISLRVKKLSESAKIPTRESQDAAGYDLYRYVL